MVGDRIQIQFSVFNPKNGGPKSKIVCLGIVLTFCIKKFSLFMAEIETNFYMFSIGFSYCSKDQWQFCNFLHKLTNSILVIKHTIFLTFLTCSMAMKPNYSLHFFFELSANLLITPFCFLVLRSPPWSFLITPLRPLCHRLPRSFLIITLNLLINPQLTLFFPFIKMASQPGGEPREGEVERTTDRSVWLQS